MMEVVYYVATSVDGYISGTDGNVDWLSDYQTQDYGYQAFFESMDLMIMGRRTFDQVQGFGNWPYGNKPCHVFSRSSSIDENEHTRNFSGSPEEFVASTADLTVANRNAWLVGGSELASAFRANDLITRFIITVIPVLLGDGIPLFSRHSKHSHLALHDVRSFDNGVQQMTYDRLQPNLSTDSITAN